MVVGVGSLDGGDDQLGLTAVRRLRQLLGDTVHFREDPTGGTRLTDVCESGLDALWIIDAALATPDAPAGTHLRLTYPRDAARLKTLSGCNTHAPVLLDQLRLLETLGWLPTRTTLHVLTAERFETGSALSPALTQPLDDLVGAVADEVRADSP